MSDQGQGYPKIRVRMSFRRRGNCVPTAQSDGSLLPIASQSHTYEEPEKAAAEPEKARRAAAENFIFRLWWWYWSDDPYCESLVLGQPDYAFARDPSPLTNVSRLD